jgi:hypothetical protein
MLPFGVLSMLGGIIAVRSLIFGSAFGLLGGISGKYMYSYFFK